MRYFEPFETEIKKQVYIKDIHDEHITEKTIMRNIAKNDNFEQLNLDNILIHNRDKDRTKIGMSTWVINEDSSVWTILGKAVDMNGDSIPNTYNLLLLGKLKPIDIDMTTINHNKYITDLWNKKSGIIDECESLFAYIFNVMDRPFKLHKDGERHFTDARRVLEKYMEYKTKLERKVKLYKYISVSLCILFLFSILF